MKTKCTRGIIYFIGLIVLALGIVLNTKTLLGVSPIISIPYLAFKPRSNNLCILLLLCVDRGNLKRERI